jgi:hypothetical protein
VGSVGDPCADLTRIVSPELFQILQTLGSASYDDFGTGRWPSHGQNRAVLDVVKALAALDPAGFGLDDICAQLEGSTYVMADEARPHFLR